MKKRLGEVIYFEVGVRWRGGYAFVLSDREHTETKQLARSSPLCDKLSRQVWRRHTTACTRNFGTKHNECHESMVKGHRRYM